MLLLYEFFIFPMQRIYQSGRPEKEFRSDDSELHHQFSRVLRARVGDRVIFFGESWSCEYEIHEITKKEIVFMWKRDTKVTPNTRNITLFQALPNKFEKMEYLVQKATEVGISRFVFFRAERSQPLVISDKKWERLRIIAREALEQSGGFHLPEISILESGLVKSTEKLCILHTESDKRTKTLKEFSNTLSKTENVGIIVGPEGGFSSEEVEKYITLGATPVSLGVRILRTETAGVVAGFTLLQ